MNDDNKKCDHNIYDRKKVAISDVELYDADLYFDVNSICGKCNIILSVGHYVLPMEFIAGLEIESCYYDDLDKKGKRYWNKIPTVKTKETREKEWDKIYEKRYNERRNKKKNKKILLH